MKTPFPIVTASIVVCFSSCKNKVKNDAAKIVAAWKIYAYHRETGEIAAFVWGKRDLKTARELKKKLLDFGVGYGSIITDDWDSFVVAFKGENHLVGKNYTVGIEGNNYCLRHRIRRAFRKTCCFSKKLFNHLKAFNLAFFYINFGFI